MVNQFIIKSSVVIHRSFNSHFLKISERQFTKKHEWISVDNGIGTVGVTSYAQEQLGDIVYVQLPEIGLELEEGGMNSLLHIYSISVCIARVAVQNEIQILSVNIT